MKLWIIDDASTRFSSEDMRANGGTWDAKLGFWTFASPSSAANALAALYRATRASTAQRETLTSLIEEGIGAHAWEIEMDGVDQASWLESLSREEASRLITQAIVAAKVLCHRPLEDRSPAVQYDRFDASGFEQAQARRARTRRAHGARVAR
jgi:hypothetical protein